MAGKFTLNILGSASAKPNLYRQSSAQLLQAAEHLFLIDCAEGTQQAFLRQNRKLKEWSAAEHIQGLKRISKTRLDAIFISHIHGDHIFGLFPLLNTMALSGRTKPLKIFGPNNLGPVLTFYKSFWGEKDSFNLEFTPLKMKEPEQIMEVAGLEVSAFPLKHGIDTFGFLFRETSPALYKKEEYKPRSYTYCSDTADFPELAGWVKGVDLLYHEATYMAADKQKADARFHSTTLDAARCALEAGAGRLLIGHYSSSVKEEDIHGSYLDEARSLFPDTVSVDDGDIFDVPLQKL
ncbi:MAG: ribonuclease Z [Bacteroidales bacterium]|nr:ribonuclease Z [Bacteroidales bacterium]